MKHLALRPIAIFCSALILLALTGCSRVSVMYNTADFFIERYADDYVSLDSSQLARWQPALETALSHHRQDELPYLARFFGTAYKGARQGFDEDRMRCLWNQFEVIYRRHFRIAVNLAAPLLADLTPAQVRTLARKFAKGAAEETKEDTQSIARRNRKRAERYAESIEWWTGPLTGRQKTIIRETTAAMPDTAADWVAYRTAKRAKLIRMLEQSASEAKIRRFLDDWLVEYRDLPPSLRKAHLRIRDRVSELFVRMDKTFSTQQRSHFANRLATLRNDFMGLQNKPRMAPSKCRL